MTQNPAQWIDEMMAPMRKVMAEAVQAAGDKIVGAFDKIMTGLVQGGGLAKAFGAVTGGLGKVGDKLKSAMPSSEGKLQGPKKNSPIVTERQKMFARERSASPGNAIGTHDFKSKEEIAALVNRSFSTQYGVQAPQETLDQNSITGANASLQTATPMAGTGQSQSRAR